MGERCEKLVLAPIAFAQGFLHIPPRGHIARDTEPLDDLALTVQKWHGARQSPGPRAVDAPDAMFELKHALRLHGRRDRRSDVCLVIGMDIFAQPVSARSNGIDDEALTFELPHLRPVGTHPIHDI